MFIVGRAVAGLGSSSIFTGNATTVASILPVSRRPRTMGINMGIGQMGIALGLIISGAFAPNVSWRWVFYLNLFQGIPVAAVMLFNTIPEAAAKPPPRQVLGTAIRSLDLDGFVLVAPAAIMLLLALEYGGVHGVLTFTVFFVREHRQGDSAMVPFAMLRDHVVRSAALTGFFSEAGILTADYYLAIYFQYVLDDSALMSGVHLLPKAVFIVLSVQNMGSAVWLIVANTIFHNSLRQQLQSRIAVVGLDPAVVIDAGARSVRDLGLNAAALAAVVRSYTYAVDRAMYLGTAMVAATLLFNWGLGMYNTHNIKSRIEIVDKEHGEAKPATGARVEQDVENGQV